MILGNMLAVLIFFVKNKLMNQNWYFVRSGSRTAVTSKMELFVIIVTKGFILDVAAVLDPPLFVNYFIYILIKENMARQWKILVEKNIYGKVLKKEFHVLASELIFFFFHYYFIIIINILYIEDICKIVDLSFAW